MTATEQLLQLVADWELAVGVCLYLAMFFFGAATVNSFN